LKNGRHYYHLLVNLVSHSLRTPLFEKQSAIRT
jgi:hypothetical protein